MNTHFRNPLANRITVTKVAVLGRADANRNARTADLIFQIRKPSVKFI